MCMICYECESSSDVYDVMSESSSDLYDML